jgi:hypothetical protein
MIEKKNAKKGQELGTMILQNKQRNHSGKMDSMLQEEYKKNVEEIHQPKRIEAVGSIYSPNVDWRNAFLLLTASQYNCILKFFNPRRW